MNKDKRHFDVIGQLGTLRRYARALVRNSAEAEDLVHDALVKAFERRASFKRGANLRNWLMSILHNTHVDAVRSRLSRERREDAAGDAIEPVYPASQEHAVRLAQVREAFLALPQDQREALHLVAVEDLSYQEAADTLGIPVGTLMSRVSRARARLRAFEEEGRNIHHLRLVGGDHD